MQPNASTWQIAEGHKGNFKGVATLYGSGATSYRRALSWATLTTGMGSLTAVWLARELLARFSGKGIVPDELVAQSEFGISIALAAGITVMLASRLGFPISTTHALVGSMIGGTAASGYAIDWHVLATKLMAPLLLSPLLAIVATAISYTVFRRSRIALGVGKETCHCVGSKVVDVVPIGSESTILARADQLSISLDTTVNCRDQYAGKLVGVEARPLLDVFHFLSAGMVSFARGLNDTPRILSEPRHVDSGRFCESMGIAGFDHSRFMRCAIRHRHDYWQRALEIGRSNLGRMDHHLAMRCGYFMGCIFATFRADTEAFAHGSPIRSARNVMEYEQDALQHQHAG